ncbi:MAG: hypothetical protein H8E36_09975 [Rhodospirillaceae bacterium]|nr:hypothetical protein [Rhodospirillaceae bacterium]MBL6940539.1 hypothetical protein [Rhodospirillales bacterium]
MRAHEFISEDYKVSPSQPLTLRNLHKMKNQAAKDEQQEQERDLIRSIMYSDNSWKVEALEIARLTLELDQLRAEIAQTKAETKNKYATALHSSAKQGLKSKQKSQQHITKLAKSALGRDLKP